MTYLLFCGDIHFNKVNDFLGEREKTKRSKKEDVEKNEDKML
jgi:hypothetical protein